MNETYYIFIIGHFTKLLMGIQTKLKPTSNGHERRKNKRNEKAGVSFMPPPPLLHFRRIKHTHHRRHPKQH
jgi:hypothetical protein